MSYVEGSEEMEKFLEEITSIISTQMVFIPDDTNILD